MKMQALPVLPILHAPNAQLRPPRYLINVSRLGIHRLLPRGGNEVALSSAGTRQSSSFPQLRHIAWKNGKKTTVAKQCCSLAGRLIA